MSGAVRRLGFSGLAVAGLVLAVLVAVVVAAVRLVPPPLPRLVFHPLGFDDLSGWAADDHGAALAAFLKSCARMERRPQSIAAVERDAWLAVCAGARDVADTDAKGDKSAARQFFESAFRPYGLSYGPKREGLLTGYYEPDLRGSRTRTAEFSHPLYKLPADLMTADLGRFAADLAGRQIVGRLEGRHFVPYATRAEIGAEAEDRAGDAFLWVDDPIAAFFLEIQGSGRVTLADGTMVRVGYAGKNGHAYTAIGRVLIDRGALTRESVSLFSIRDWLTAHPAEAAAVMNANRSYVFFHESTAEGAIGSEGVVLSPGRSLAVDRRIFAMGTPFWLDSSLPAGQGGGSRLARLVIAQDTGGAIVGELRGDLFWGPGLEAEELAGLMKEQARFVMLLPRALTPAGLGR